MLRGLRLIVFSVLICRARHIFGERIKDVVSNNDFDATTNVSRVAFEADLIVMGCDTNFHIETVLATSASEGDALVLSNRTHLIKVINWQYMQPLAHIVLYITKLNDLNVFGVRRFSMWMDNEAAHIIFRREREQIIACCPYSCRNENVFSFLNVIEKRLLCQAKIELYGIPDEWNNYRTCYPRIAIVHQPIQQTRNTYETPAWLRRCNHNPSVCATHKE